MLVFKNGAKTCVDQRPSWKSDKFNVLQFASSSLPHCSVGQGEEARKAGTDKPGRRAIQQCFHHSQERR